MRQQWTVPASYTYDANTTLKSLLAAFMAANEGATPKQAAAAMEVSTAVFTTWFQGKITVALTSRYKAAFERITGINLDRLLVIEAKREILSLLENIQQVRLDNPSLAWMLEKDPDLASKIDFNTLITRREMIKTLKRLADHMGGGLISMQIGVDNSVFNAWCSDRRNFFPSGELLIRIITLMTIGLIHPDPSDPVGRDEIRYQVIAERVLGADPGLVLGAATFEEALTELFKGLDKYAISVKANKTGLTQPTVRRLQAWERSEGRTSADVILQVIRKLLEKRFPHKLELFDQAAKQIKSKKKRVERPVFWHQIERTAKPTPPAEPEEEPAPAPKPPITLESVKPGTEEAPETTQVPDAVSIAFAGALAQIMEVLRLHPQLRDRLPEELKGDHEQPQTHDVLWEMDVIRRALRSTSTPHSSELESAVIRRIMELEPIIHMICSWSPEVRGRILHTVDQPLLNIADLFDALGVHDPEEFIERMSPQRDAASLAPDGD